MHVSDRPGVFSEIMVALGDAGINIEDLSMHHMSAELGGTLTLYVQGATRPCVARTSSAGLGYDVIVGSTEEDE